MLLPPPPSTLFPYTTLFRSSRTAPAATEIRSVDLREGAPEVYVDLEASAPLVWTSYRNADGRVIVELPNAVPARSEEHTSELQSRRDLVCRLLLEKKNYSEV